MILMVVMLLLTFTPSDVSGAPLFTMTASGAIFTAAMVGGVYSGNGGILRIQTFTDSTPRYRFYR